MQNQLAPLSNCHFKALDLVNLELVPNLSYHGDVSALASNTNDHRVYI